MGAEQKTDMVTISIRLPKPWRDALLVLIDHAGGNTYGANQYTACAAYHLLMSVGPRQALRMVRAIREAHESNRDALRDLHTAEKMKQACRLAMVEDSEISMRLDSLGQEILAGFAEKQSEQQASRPRRRSRGSRRDSSSE